MEYACAFQYSNRQTKGSITPTQSKQYMKLQYCILNFGQNERRPHGIFLPLMECFQNELCYAKNNFV
jgi:hypothetical protein